jgi:cytochrome b involved in lipid metabolism
LDSTKFITYGPGDVDLSILPTILKTLATSPFDFVQLHIDTTSNEARLVNDNYGMLSILPLTPKHTYEENFWLLSNIQDLHNLLSGFKIRVDKSEESADIDKEQLNFNLGFSEPTACCYPVLDTASGVITFEYESTKNGKISRYDECCIQLPIEKANYTEITTALDNLSLSYKFVLTHNFIEGCYIKARETTEEVSHFLSKPTEVRIGIRELAWLSRLTKKYGKLDCKLTSNNVMQVVTPDFTSYITLYSKRENNVSSPSN